MDKQYKPVPDVEALRYKGTPDKPDIKIFVSHRIDLDSETIDNPLYIPVRCGAAYDQRECVAMLGDDTGDNISEKRESFCELTVQYWAWKNVKADYYGLCHYRRYLSFAKTEFEGELQLHGQISEPLLTEKSAKKYGLLNSALERSEIGEYDIIVPYTWDTQKFNGPKGYSESVYDMWKAHENMLIGKKSLDIMADIIKEAFPQYCVSTKEYLNGYNVWGFNCFIMSRKLFQELCEFEFSVLKELENRLDTSFYGKELKRTFGFIGETLVGIFVYHCSKTKDIKIKQRQLVMFQDTEKRSSIMPLWDKEIPIVVTSSDYYVPYVGVFLQSLAGTCDASRNYDVIVLNKNITDQNKKRLKSVCDAFPNIGIQFYNPKHDLDGMQFYTANAVEESNYRLLAPWILKNHKKAVVMDVDIILRQDIAELYDSTVFSENEFLAAAKDVVYQGMINGIVEDAMKYATKTMKMKKPYNYVNTGVMVFDLDRIRNSIDVQDLLDFANTHHFRIQEQDLINVFYEGKIQFLDIKWNYYIETNAWITQCINYAPVTEAEEYWKAAKNPGLIHYANVPKPWDAPDSFLAEEFWTMARKTIFYEVILARLINIQTGVLHGAVYDLQLRNGVFDTRSNARKKLDKWCPPDTLRRTFVEALIPWGSRRRELCKKIYHFFTRGKA